MIRFCATFRSNEILMRRPLVIFSTALFVIAPFLGSAQGLAQGYYPSSPFTVERPLTPSERQQIEGLARAVEQRCMVELAQAQEKATKSAKSEPPWIGKLISPSNCSCIAAEIRANITPTMMRHGTEADGANVVHSAASTCAIRNLVMVIPEMCRSMIVVARSKQTSAPAAESKIDLACKCTQTTVVASFSTRTIEDYAGETIRAYQDFRKHPGSKPPASPNSLYGQLLSCARGQGLIK